MDEPKWISVTISLPPVRESVVVKSCEYISDDQEELRFLPHYDTFVGYCQSLLDEDGISSWYWDSHSRVRGVVKVHPHDFWLRIHPMETVWCTEKQFRDFGQYDQNLLGPQEPLT